MYLGFRLLFGLILGSLSEYFKVCFGRFFGEGLQDRFGCLFGSILEVFWTDLGSIFGETLEVFL